MMLDVLVVGAGPAGCSAAARLNRAGATVAMVHHPRRNERPSEALAGAAAQLMAATGLGDVESVTDGRCGGTLSAWNSGELAATDSFAAPDGAGWWVDRGRFDAALRERCAALGVEVMTDCVKAVRRHQRYWVVNSASGADMAAGWLIDATGRAGAVARQLGASRRVGPKLVAVHARTTGISRSVPSRVFLEAEPDGWWYVGGSSRNRIGATAVVQPSIARSLLAKERFVKRLGQTRHLAEYVRRHSDWSDPCTSPASSSVLDPVFGAGWVACGDAAIAFDPLSGHGLVGALVSGLAAAEAIRSVDTMAKMQAIAARHVAVLRIYEHRRGAAYSREQRWSDQPFWSAQSGWWNGSGHR